MGRLRRGSAERESIEKQAIECQVRAVRGSGDTGNSGESGNRGNNINDVERIAADAAVPADEADPLAQAVEGGVHYKSMHWVQAGAVMVAETISLGILSLPKVMATLGFLPGVLVIIFIGAMAVSLVLARLLLIY